MLLELDATERARRALLATSDDLLDEVEVLRLRDQAALPEQLGAAVATLQAKTGRPPNRPSTVPGAHDLILAAQQRLMAANPRNATTRSLPGRGGGQFVTARLPHGQRWKLLALPPRPPAGAEAAWIELLDGTVERARDRWEYAHQRAVRAAREGGDAVAALELARAAWDNYWELREEALRLVRNASRRRLRVMAGAAAG